MCEIMDNIRNKGRDEGIINTLVQQLKQKLGGLTPEIELQIQKSTEKQLNELTIHIFDVENEEDIIEVLSC